MSDLNNKGFTTAEYPTVGSLTDEVATKAQCLKLIYSMYHGQMSLETCLNRLAITDWDTFDDKSTVDVRPQLDYTA